MLLDRKETQKMQPHSKRKPLWSGSWLGAKPWASDFKSLVANWHSKMRRLEKWVLFNLHGASENMNTLLTQFERGHIKSLQISRCDNTEPVSDMAEDQLPLEISDIFSILLWSPQLPVAWCPGVFTTSLVLDRIQASDFCLTCVSSDPHHNPRWRRLSYFNKKIFEVWSHDSKQQRQG